MPFADAQQWFVQFAAAAVRTQEIFDQAWQQELDRFQHMIAQSPAECRELLRPLAPARQLLKQYEFELSTVVSVSKLQGFTVQLLPLNLSYSITRSSRSESHSKFKVVVEQVPIQE